MIYIAGSLNMDLCIESPYMPKSGETITGGGFITNGGGKGANQATAAAKLGGKIKMCGVVGADSFGETLLKNLSAAGADVSSVRTESGVPTGIAVIIITDGNNRIILDKGANAHLKKSDIDEFLKDAKPGDIYLTQLENPIDIIGYGLKRAKELGLYTILNPAPANKEIEKYFAFADLITPNETELEIFGGKQNLFNAGIKKIVTTLGSKGYEIADEKTSAIYPCIKVKAVDTTAAGDTLCGGLAVGLDEGLSLEDACAFGSKAASIACTRKGAQQSIPLKSEVIGYKG
ncbi:MAG: ribokinase [Candidatus Borkfalkiaceae bacterium]|nr:ribokinase [Christensenellaceae bacterium]